MKLDTILDKLNLFIDYKEFDCRYMEKWILKYPHCFPKYCIKGNYDVIFNSKKFRYEVIRKI